jgi:hypothetical protein
LAGQAEKVDCISGLENQCVIFFEWDLKFHFEPPYKDGNFPSSNKELKVVNVYVEPCPKGRPEGTAITHFVLEYAHGARVTPKDYSTQGEAVVAAKGLGHSPLVARVRNTNKGIPDHWRSA